MNRILLLAFFAFAALISNRAETLMVVFGSNASEQPIPFGSGSGRMQQIYPSSLFNAVASEQILISGVSFRASQPFATDITGMRMLMAQTAAQEVTFDFSADLGPGSVEVLARGDYALNASSSSVVIPMTRSFVYDRTKGNLILDLQFTASSQPGRLEFSYGQNANLMAFNVDPNAAGGVAFQSGGLRTEFTFTPVPEPTTLAILIAGAITAFPLLTNRRKSV